MTQPNSRKNDLHLFANITKCSLSTCWYWYHWYSRSTMYVKCSIVSSRATGKSKQRTHTTAHCNINTIQKLIYIHIHQHTTTRPILTPTPHHHPHSSMSPTSSSPLLSPSLLSKLLNMPINTLIPFLNICFSSYRNRVANRNLRFVTLNPAVA